MFVSVVVVVFLALSLGKSTEAPHRLFFGSCYNQKLEGLWHLVLENKPDKLILLGDNIYADYRPHVLADFVAASIKNLTDSYHLLASNVDFMALVQQVGGWGNVFATWDDHDYGRNDADASYSLRNESKEIFNSFFHIPESDRRIDGVYSSKTVYFPFPPSELLFQYRVILLDTRYNRVMEDKDQCDYLGESQWSWLEEQLTFNSTGNNTHSNVPDLILIGSGHQVLSTHKIVEDNWDDCPSSKVRLMDLLMKSKVRYTDVNMLLLSGDVHTAEIIQSTCTVTSTTEGATRTQQFPLVDLTSSGLSHTFTKITTPRSTQPQALSSARQAVVVNSRGFLMELLYNTYQASMPAHHRQFRFLDHYQGPHYALLDIAPHTRAHTHAGESAACGSQLELDSDDSASESCARDGRSDSFTVTFRLMDHLNNEVITREYAFSRRDHYDVLLTNAETEAIPVLTSVSCEPYWGIVPKWKIMMFWVSMGLVIISYLSAIGLCIAFICRSVYVIIFAVKKAVS